MNDNLKSKIMSFNLYTKQNVRDLKYEKYRHQKYSTNKSCKIIT